MKYLGITCGWILEGFEILPSIALTWMHVEDEMFISGRNVKKRPKAKIRKYYDLQFAWLFWYFTIGCINKRVKEMHR